MADIGDKQDIPREAMFVFHLHGPTINFQGNVQGSNVAVGGSSIAGTTAMYNNNAELADALLGLKSFVEEVVENRRQTVETAIDLLVKAATDGNVPTVEVERATEVVATASPALREWLTDIAKKVGLSLVSSSIFQAIKMALGIH